ncbi:MAG: 1-acyl-sn-glycerol-3-phosphate acyltransferase [Bacteroidales bacterium]|nr:1-acyl-sn-glycerol-3-phosphate acyltransferase [Bacteroidales bacterium]
MRKAILYIYTLLAYMVLYPFTFLIVLLILTLNTFSFKKAIPFVIRFWASSTFLIIGKTFSIEGRENLDKSRKYILMANHSSIFDIMGIMAICPNIVWFGRANLMDIPVFGKLLEAINFIPMKSTDLKNAKFMIEQLVRSTENKTVAIFPEGTRTTNGEMNNFRKGFLHVLKASQLELLPVSLIGFYEYKPKNRFYFDYSQKLSAKIHAPIPYSELKNLEDKEIITIVKSKIESGISLNKSKTK